MSRNSFKFLSLALAASLTVAPISAIDWNSNSTRFGLGLAIIGLAYIAYNYYSKKSTPISYEWQRCLNEAQKQRLNSEQKQKLYDFLKSIVVAMSLRSLPLMSRIAVEEFVKELGNPTFSSLVQTLYAKVDASEELSAKTILKTIHYELDLTEDSFLAGVNLLRTSKQ